MTLGPGASVLRAQVQAILEKARREDPRVFGFRSEGGWSGAPSIEIEGERYTVSACRSALEVRERLAELDEQPHRLIIITPLAESDLGEDVVARLARRRLAIIEPWEGAVRLFQATRADQRLSREPWMANALIEAAPPGGYAAVPAGVLDRDTAWTAFLTHRLGLPDGRPDAVSILRWTLDPGGVARYESLDPTVRQGIHARFQETAGAAGAVVARCLDAGHGLLAVPLGVALRVVFAESVAGDAAVPLRQGAVRIERYAGGSPIEARAALLWATAAELVLRETADLKVRHDASARADALLDQIGAAAFSYVSDWSLRGFEQRLVRFAEGLGAALRDARLPLPSLDALRSHQFAAAHLDRVRRGEMAVRLVRWLRAMSADVSSLDDVAAEYVRSTSFVDLARTALRAGDAAQPVAEVYATVLSLALERRERQNRCFGERLAGWLESGSTGGRLLPVEQIIDRVIAPLAREAPVLFVITDGMSVAVWRELSEDLYRQGWVALEPADGPVPGGVATVPSVTQHSRASLLSGALASGTSADEKRGFEAHPSLVRASRVQFPPVLFHKGELSQAGGRALADAVRAEIASPDRRVVAAVVNAVDDYLAKADQVRPRWSLEFVPALAALLHEARNAGRVVVIASDHGHILDDETRMNRSEHGDRWRGGEGAPKEGEVVLAGPRVRAAGGRVVAPWSEGTRYGMRKNGYHGGATPQEMIVPVAVVAAGVHVSGWVERGPVYPEWWEEPVAPAVPVTARERGAAPASPQPIKRRGRPAPPLLEQFDLEPASAAAPPATWVDALLRSGVLAAQKRLAGRVAPPDDQLRALLYALEDRGGKLTRAALAARLNLPLVRLGSFLAAARRVLNVEGYAVLRLDEASDTIELNRGLLVAQFELAEGAERFE